MLNRQPEDAFRLQSACYRIFDNKLLGKGLNSQVYEGVNIFSAEPVCIKKINVADHLQQKLTLNQIQCLKEISHQNVIRYVCDFKIGKIIFLVTELCQENLYTKLIRNKKFTEKEAIQIFKKILAGYKQLRSKGYLHRDLKPQNIFFKESQVKIGDLGFSIKSLSSELAQQYNVGTPLYMAPEVIERNLYSQKSDIWSLGIILYELLHGKVPFSSQTEKDLIEQIKKSNFIYSCHPKLEQMLRNMLNKKKVLRYTLKDLSQSLIKYLSEVSRAQNIVKRSQIERKIANEIRYVQFLEYVKFIFIKCKKAEKKERIKFLFQFTIQMRISLIQSLEQSSKINQEKLVDQLKQIKSKHSEIPKLPQILNQQDRLRFLDSDKPRFNYFTLWHIQAELKDILKQMLVYLTSIDTEEKVSINEQFIRITDFLLTTFFLNQMLIQSEDCMQQFQRIFRFNHISNAPQRFNLRVCEDIKEKGMIYGII